MVDPKGYAGRILRLDLTSRTYKEEPLREDLAQEYIGGEGIGARILWEELKPGIDPFSSENKLIFAVGPLQGTKCPSASRACVVTKGPLTLGFARSLSGGDFAYEFKRSGYDAIIVEGRSENPVYLWIKGDEDSEVRFRDAEFLWSMGTGDTQRFVKNYTDKKAEVLCIGPAGEKLARMACIIAGIGAFGRGGAGAVMGSKNLKAIAVHGTMEPELKDPDDFDKAVKKAYSNFSKEKAKAEHWRLYGTMGMVDIIESHGNWPTRNWQEGVFPGADETLYSGPMRRSVVKKDIACILCPVFCRKVSFGGVEGPFAGMVSEGPEYETIWAFGAQCANDDPRAIAAADRYCDELGLDTISCGSTIGFAMELYQRGLIKKEDLDGVELTWGNGEAMVEMIRRIGQRTGIGDTLAEGVKRAAERIGRGAEEYAMHVKGLELPAYDPRGQYGMGLNYATANRGGCHTTGYTTYDEVTGPLDRFTTTGKAELVIRRQNETCARNSAILCKFGGWGTEPVMDELLTSATGIEFTADSIFLAGERVYNLERAFNIREGFARENDNLPRRLLDEPLPRGPARGHVVKLKPMLDEYYQLRGWDDTTGIPDRRKLEELGLSDVARELGHR